MPGIFRGVVFTFTTCEKSDKLLGLAEAGRPGTQFRFSVIGDRTRVTYPCPAGVPISTNEVTVCPVHLSGYFVRTDEDKVGESPLQTVKQCT